MQLGMIGLGRMGASLERRRWSAQLALAIAAATVLVFAAFGIHVANGGAFEVRTVWAMTLRSVVWISIAMLALPAIKREAAAGCARNGQSSTVNR